MTEEALVHTRERVLGGTYRTFYSSPLIVDSASGCTITDATGREYLDAYNNVPVIGHSSIPVREAVDKQLGQANVHTRYIDSTVVSYAERLVGTFPETLESVVFACSGSEANDLALRLAKHVTGRPGIIVTKHAYHGTTSATAEISPSLVGIDRIGDHVEVIELPAWDDSDFDGVFARSFRAGCERLDQRGHPCGAFILDSAMTSDGIVEPQSLVQTIDSVRDAGALYIADEVQSGFGRTGSMWGFERLHVEPDLVTLGKPMANGMALSAVVGRHEIFQSYGRVQRYFNTFAGTTVPVAAADVVLSSLTSGALAEQATTGGAFLADSIRRSIREVQFPAHVRQNGLMIGVDLLDSCTEAEAEERAAFIVEHLYREGVLVSTTGPCGNVVKIRPPLVISNDQLAIISEGFTLALRRLEMSERSPIG